MHLPFQVSKISLVDLAGSERADSTGAKGTRLKVGPGCHTQKGSESAQRPSVQAFAAPGWAGQKFCVGMEQDWATIKGKPVQERWATQAGAFGLQ